MKILKFTFCLSIFYLFSIASFAQIRHNYAELNPPINDDFPFDVGIIDLDKLNPVNFLKDKIGRDTVQVWNKSTKSWYTDYIQKNNFSPKCGNIKSRLDYQIDSLNREILVNANI